MTLADELNKLAELRANAGLTEEKSNAQRNAF